MNSVPTPNPSSQPLTDLAQNFGPLAELICKDGLYGSGGCLKINNAVRVAVTSF